MHAQTTTGNLQASLKPVSRQLWLLRHGDAEPHGARPDADRRLTDRGQTQATNAGLAIAALGVKLDVVYTSPRVRARDTARLACEGLGIEPIEHAPLGGDFDRSDADQLLGEWGDETRVMVVGHEPDLSQLVYDFTGGRVDMKKGGIAAVRIMPAGGELLALLRPREIELLGRSRA